eukprot:14255606-Alexandrium_andersonii.AAC.1
MAAVGVRQGQEAHSLELLHGSSQPARESGACLSRRGVDVASEAPPGSEHLELRVPPVREGPLEAAEPPP